MRCPTLIFSSDKAAGKIFTWNIRQGQNIFLEFCQFGHKSADLSIWENNLTTDNIPESGQEIFCPGISHIFSIGHEVIQSIISLFNILSAGSPDNDDELKCDPEQAFSMAVSDLSLYLLSFPLRYSKAVFVFPTRLSNLHYS
jgi:hypothetical protein